MAIHSSNHSHEHSFENRSDEVETYFECITTCSIDDNECITRCVEQLRDHKGVNTVIEK